MGLGKFGLFAIVGHILSYLVLDIQVWFVGKYGSYLVLYIFGLFPDWSFDLRVNLFGLLAIMGHISYLVLRKFRFVGCHGSYLVLSGLFLSYFHDNLLSAANRLLA